MSTANPAQVGRIGCADWLITFKIEFLGFQTMMNMDLWGILFHAVVVFPLEPDFLFKSFSAHCDS